MLSRLPLVMAFGVLCCAQQTNRANVATLFDFELGVNPNDVSPRGWSGGPAGTLFADNQTFHSGKWSARLQRGPASDSTFSTITMAIPADAAGKTIEYRGYLKLEGVSEYVGLWLREDGESGPVAFDNMQSRNVKGSADWKQYSIQLPLQPNAKQIVFGVLMTGTGRLWADDLELLVDGKPIAQAPGKEIPQTILDRDHEFDSGSKITFTELSKTQVDNLALLGKVWGFLKYHHEAITAGERHWDYDLFRIAPKILEAKDGAAAQGVLHRWIISLPLTADCVKCVSLNDSNLAMKPDLGWLRDRALLGADLMADLDRAYGNRTGKQFYVSKYAGAGGPQFEHEPPYPSKAPDAGMRLLALFRFWNLVEYWYPNRDITGNNWDQVLLEFIPRVGLAATAEQYQLELMQLIGKVNDTHANLWSSLQVRPPVGACGSSASLRFLDGKAVVWETTDTVLQRGDVIDRVDGTEVAELVAKVRPFYDDSNEPTRLRDIARALLRGPCQPAKLHIVRGGRGMDVEEARGTAQPSPYHDRSGPGFQLLSPEIAYVSVANIRDTDFPLLAAAAQTKGLIIDARDYPGYFSVFTLGGRLVDKETPFMNWTRLDLANPGAFEWFKGEPLRPIAPQYKGKVVVLVDEVTQSSSEYHSMAFRAAGAKIIGSTTAGADGNVSPIVLPGGLEARFSGLGVFYPDKRGTQRVGIVPDIEVFPTVAGIREGRDEVLELGIREILGAGASEESIRAWAKR